MHGIKVRPRHVAKPNLGCVVCSTRKVPGETYIRGCGSCDSSSTRLTDAFGGAFKLALLALPATFVFFVDLEDLSP